MDYYRFKTEKYRKATRHLDTFQHGCYRLLIDEYMITGEPLPDNDQALANICHCTLQAFSEHASSTIRAFFTAKDGLLFHDYCDDELNFQDTRRRFASEKAQKAAKARHNKNKSLDATSMPQECLAMPELRVKSQDISPKGDIDSPLPPKLESADIEQAVSDFNALADRIGLPRVQKLSETRRKHLRARLADCGGLQGWRAALEKLEAIPAMRGQNNRGWKADFDFITRESSFIKLMEGGYDNWGNDGQSRSDITKQQLKEWVES